jgi:hypothetical protein
MMAFQTDWDSEPEWLDRDEQDYLDAEREQDERADRRMNDERDSE